jgi:hypothetical protein
MRWAYVTAATTASREICVGKPMTLLIATVVLVSFGVDSAATGAFKPADGRYKGEYTSGNHGPGNPRLEVGLLRPGLHGVRLLKWSGKLRCPGTGLALTFGDERGSQWSHLQRLRDLHITARQGQLHRPVHCEKPSKRKCA